MDMGDWTTEPELHADHRRGWGARWRLDTFSARFRFVRLGCAAAKVGLLRPICQKLSSAIAVWSADSNFINAVSFFIGTLSETLSVVAVCISNPAWFNPFSSRPPKAFFWVRPLARSPRIASVRAGKILIVRCDRAKGFAEESFSSDSHDAMIRVYDPAGNVIETHKHKGDFRKW